MLDLDTGIQVLVQCYLWGSCTSFCCDDIPDWRALISRDRMRPCSRGTATSAPASLAVVAQVTIFLNCQTCDPLFSWHILYSFAPPWMTDRTVLGINAISWILKWKGNFDLSRCQLVIWNRSRNSFFKSNKNLQHANKFVSQKVSFKTWIFLANKR